MARPIKWRRIEHIPAVQHFVPTDGGNENPQENVLKLEELEALRLKDLEGLEQEDCAQKMEVSRPTFHRILLSAREKVTDSLVSGKAIRIEGGNFTRNICPVRCMDCGNEWLDSYENMEGIEQDEYTCPKCGSTRLVCGHGGGPGRFCRRNCWRHGQMRE